MSAVPVLFGILASFSIAVIVILAGTSIERSGSFTRQNTRGVLFNILYYALASVLQKVLGPAGGAVTAFAVGHTAGGLVALPSKGWWVIPAALLYIAAMDLGEYLFHRAQHRIPFLWSMHMLHHSDPDVNISTSVRHFWAENLLKSVTIYLAVGLLFKASPTIAFLYWLAAFYNYFVHMRLPIGLGRLGRVMNSPQYHRIHHSRLPEHAGCNFAGLFSLFDVIFGTYRRPLPGEFPPTGLSNGDCPTGPLAALAWPLRRFALHRAPSTAH